MSGRILKLIVAIFSILFFTTKCGDTSDNINTEIQREFTSFSRDQILKSHMESFSSSVANGRLESKLVDRINWSKAYRNHDKKKNRTSYTIPLIVETPNQFDNLIITEDNGKSEKSIIRYKPDPNWLATKPRRGGFSTFTGVIEKVELSGDIKISTIYKDGKVVGPSAGYSKNGRTDGDGNCYTLIVVNWTEVCVGGGAYCSITEVTWTEYEVCGGGGSGSGTGGTGTGGIGTGAPTPEGGGGGTPIGSSGGSSGVTDPVDVSYYLKPIKPGDDMSRPYDGMQATDKNGVVYTYDASINAWLMPDLVVLSENGYNIQFDNKQSLNNFDGAVLSTTMTLGLVEPTQIGKVVIGTIVLVVVLYELYQISTKEYDTNLEHCTRLFVLCTGKYAHKNLPCSSCQQFCVRQGYWDTLNCPLR